MLLLCTSTLLRGALRESTKHSEVDSSLFPRPIIDHRRVKQTMGSCQSRHSVNCVGANILGQVKSSKAVRKVESDETSRSLECLPDEYLAPYSPPPSGATATTLSTPDGSPRKRSKAVKPKLSLSISQSPSSEAGTKKAGGLGAGDAK